MLCQRSTQQQRLMEIHESHFWLLFWTWRPCLQWAVVLFILRKEGKGRRAEEAPHVVMSYCCVLWVGVCTVPSKPR